MKPTIENINNTPIKYLIQIIVHLDMRPLHFPNFLPSFVLLEASHKQDEG